jgi:hypothetical protein
MEQERSSAINASELLEPPREGDLGWVSENTALLIVHGIGNQMPLETLDQFGRGLVSQYRAKFGEGFGISHEIVVKQGDGDDKWFDNVLRLRKKDSSWFIDLYEYYWADYTQDKASWKEMSQWLEGVVNGAGTFYQRNAAIGKEYHDRSIFFGSDGKFNLGKYRWFLFSVGRIFLVLDGLYRGLLWLIGRIPFCGSIASSLFKSYADGKMHDLVNVISEVCIYNVVDPKSKWYRIRRAILDGAVNAVRYMIERSNESGDLYYSSVIVCGHSLGTQIAYDAINKIDLLVNEGLIKHYDRDGVLMTARRTPIARQLRGFVTFGSPLDKVAFFLRENVPDADYIWQQFLDNYHHFKMHNLDFENDPSSNPQYLKASCNLRSLLNSVQWRNYYDHKDYVSGSLDYYWGLTNVDCHFEAGRFGFTHSYYWDCSDFYGDIITHFLQP